MCACNRSFVCPLCNCHGKFLWVAQKRKVDTGSIGTLHNEELLLVVQIVYECQEMTDVLQLQQFTYWFDLSVGPITDLQQWLQNVQEFRLVKLRPYYRENRRKAEFNFVTSVDSTLKNNSRFNWASPITTACMWNTDAVHIIVYFLISSHSLPVFCASLNIYLISCWRDNSYIDHCAVQCCYPVNICVKQRADVVFWVCFCVRLQFWIEFDEILTGSK